MNGDALYSFDKDMGNDAGEVVSAKDVTTVNP
jgi:hypothetical protein